MFILFDYVTNIHHLGVKIEELPMTLHNDSNTFAILKDWKQKLREKLLISRYPEQGSLKGFKDTIPDTAKVTLFSAENDLYIKTFISHNTRLLIVTADFEQQLLEQCLKILETKVKKNHLQTTTNT